MVDGDGKVFMSPKRWANGWLHQAWSQACRGGDCRASYVNYDNEMLDSAGSYFGDKLQAFNHRR